jgi:amino acid transporter
MELVIASAAVAKGFSGYFGSLIKSLDQAGPHRLDHWSGSFALSGPGANGTMLSIDLVAMAAVLIITLLLVVGIKVRM